MDNYNQLDAVLPNRTELHLRAMRQVEQYSSSLNTISWIWGGFTVDICENRSLREHDDLDYLTLNLHSLMPEFITLFEEDGWQTILLSNGDLNIKSSGVKIHLGHVEISGKARWTHNGDKGSIWFPCECLNPHPKKFCGFEIHVVEPEFQYVVLERPHMLNPDWQSRQKDIQAQHYLRKYIEAKGIRSESLLKLVSDSYLSQA
ncbi:MAG TPA: hypothetical protein VK897_11705 [Anaerolineales bacterium]|nr:hypothetical protein [Anaerolineales bacterium]